MTTAIGHRAPPGCVGIHLNFVMYRPTPDEIAEATPHEQAMPDSMGVYQDGSSGYSKLQGTRPRTLGYSLADPPAGQAAWIYAMFQDVSDSGNAERVFTRDETPDDIMLYWLPNAGASSARLYWEGQSSMSGPPPEPMRMPTAISMFAKEPVRISRRRAERRFDRLVHFNELKAIRHFAALEQPALLADEIRAGFRGLRA